MQWWILKFKKSAPYVQAVHFRAQRFVFEEKSDFSCYFCSVKKIFLQTLLELLPFFLFLSFDLCIHEKKAIYKKWQLFFYLLNLNDKNMKSMLFFSENKSKTAPEYGYFVYFILFQKTTKMFFFTIFFLMFFIIVF